MKTHAPTSNERIGRFIDFRDVLSVILAGPIAFVLRDQNLIVNDHAQQTFIYCAMASVAGLLMLVVFHLGKNLSDYVSTQEVQSVVKAALATTTLTSFALFSVTRLDFVPRSIPVIHFLVLTSLMFFFRAVAAKRREYREKKNVRVVTNPEYVLLIGANRLAWFYLRLVDNFDLGRTTIVAILDDDARLFGRSMIGYPVLAPPSELHRVISEYRVHGVRVNKVLIAANRQADAGHCWRGVEDYCRNSDISLDFLGDMLGIELDAPAPSDQVIEASAFSVRPYFKFKRVFDFSISSVVICALSPVFVLVGLGVLIDVGWPVVFWQKRDGRAGAPFLVYKFRTLRAPFDRRGRFVEDGQRTSRFGRLLRRTRLDELPQMWNVMAGDMSFVGPRPLLLVDQPRTSALRLRVLPGLTGWAQIHGGKLVAVDEKGVLDDWYVEHASLWLDIRIILRTAAIVILGDRRAERKPPSKVVEEGRRDAGQPTFTGQVQLMAESNLLTIDAFRKEMLVGKPKTFSQRGSRPPAKGSHP
ncbi:MAG: sugar transferase [Roseiarcus sp.]